MNQKADSCAGGVNVLVVEDEVLVRLTTVTSLEDMGCTTREAGSADEALGIIHEHPEIRLVFTDIEMPGNLDGLELAEYIREMAEYRCSHKLRTGDAVQGNAPTRRSIHPETLFSR